MAWTAAYRTVLWRCSAALSPGSRRPHTIRASALTSFRRVWCSRYRAFRRRATPDWRVRTTCRRRRRPIARRERLGAAISRRKTYFAKGAGNTPVERARVMNWLQKAIRRERDALERARRRFIRKPTEKRLHDVRTSGRRFRSLLEDVADLASSRELLARVKRAAAATDAARDASIVLRLLDAAIDESERQNAVVAFRAASAARGRSDPTRAPALAARALRTVDSMKPERIDLRGRRRHVARAPSAEDPRARSTAPRGGARASR